MRFRYEIHSLTSQTINFSQIIVFRNTLFSIVKWNQQDAHENKLWAVGRAGLNLERIFYQYWNSFNHKLDFQKCCNKGLTTSSLCTYKQCVQTDWQILSRTEEGAIRVYIVRNKCGLHGQGSAIYRPASSAFTGLSANTPPTSNEVNDHYRSGAFYMTS